MFAKLQSVTKNARLARDPLAVLLVAVTSEAQAAAKRRDPMNPIPNDGETVAAIRKYIKTAEENIAIKRERGVDFSKDQSEYDLLSGILPVSPSEDDVRATIAGILSTLDPSLGAKRMGSIMAGLKVKYGTALDNSLASRLAKAAL